MLQEEFSSARVSAVIAMDSTTKTTSTNSKSKADQEQVSSSSRPQARRNWLWIMLHLILYPIFRIWVRTGTLHADRLKREQGGILLINHQSFLDPILVAVRIARPIAYLARDSLFKIPGISFVLRNCFAVSISRTAFRGSSVHTALDRLEQGFLIALFPEGTRGAGAPQQFRPGFLSIVRRTDAPVYPVAVVGADAVLPRGAWFPRPKAVTVVYGDPLTREEQQTLNEVDDKTAAAMIEAKVSELYHKGLRA